ncbi:MAG: hypothetical protein J6Z49_07415 [Kiritimatiellae bacterium]|nr:hypothetical protein [Kiritimatiellia bacterium]
MTGKQVCRGNRRQSMAIDGDRKTRADGSALLIVLGFLSFMMVSAVSFAIYMRIEREASSNYRQTAMSRHLLNTALVRAMDEIDSELRITGYADSNRKMAGGAGTYKELPDDVSFVAGTVPPFKFPLHWPGRVRCSAVANRSGNSGNTRVLSLDALAYLPAALANDVRRWAIPNEQDYREGGGKFGDDQTQNEVGESIRAYNSDENWRGAKWRPIYLPLGSFEGRNNANARSQVGRYAYICVNLSDMLDINKCRALSQNVNCVSNRIDIGYLFAENAADQGKFDDSFLETDRYYASIADFYSCMNQHRLKPFSQGGNDQTPYHYWLARQSSGGDADQPDRYFGLDTKRWGASGIFSTDGIVKAEPRDGDKGFNLKAQPLFNGGNDSSIIGAKVTPGDSGIFTGTLLSDGLGQALERILSKGTDAADAAWTGLKRRQHYGVMLADYLDDDRLPRVLCTPCMERVPQINRIVIKQPDFLEAVLECDEQELDERQVKRIWKLSVREKSGEWFTVQTLFPFRYDPARDTKVYYCSLRLCVYAGIGEELNHKMKIRGAATAAAPISSSGEVTATGRMVPSGEGYRIVTPDLTGKVDFDNPATFEETVNKGAPLKCPGNCNVRVVMVGYIWEGSGTQPVVTKLVDVVPMNMAAYNETVFLGENTPKLSFWANNIAFPNVQKGENKATVNWEYTNLECPDVRFNYRINNWVRNNDTTPIEKADSKDVGAKAAAVTAGAKLAASLMGQDGRDGDWYQMSNDSGALRAPGEFGFFPRSYKFQQNDTDDLATSLTDCYNYQSFYRTVRLYDHGSNSDQNRARDPVFRYLYYANEDGTVDGARVNPLTDMPLVLAAAVYGMPQDYGYAAEYEPTRKKLIYGGKPAQSTGGNLFSENEWKEFTNGWSTCLIKARNESLNGRPGIPTATRFSGGGDPTLATSYAYNLSDVYGDDQFFGWYTSGNERLLFQGNSAGAAVASFSKPLPECYRKMIYSYSLDNFSDRQQLFLYIIRAEAVVPTMSSSIASKSLAGGHAVALVWRDPYPEGYKKTLNGNAYSESWTQSRIDDLYEGEKSSNEKTLYRVSPWYQYSLKNQRGDLVEDEDNAGRNEFGTSTKLRKDDNVRREELGSMKGAYHEQRVLFFKVLDD